jgi:hypothetical protein
MTSQKKTRKNLGRTLAVVATIGSFAALTSLPAVALEESWTLEVNVSDTSCTTPDTPPSWNPDPSVSYTYDNDVDLNPFSMNPPGLVLFSVGLGLLEGSQGCDPFGPISPSGEIEASVTGLDSELSMAELDCTSLTVCDAGTLYINNNSIMGTIDATGVTTIGDKTGTLTVVWTPSD